MDWKLGGLILALVATSGCQRVGEYVEVREARASVASAMRDPGSAEFMDLRSARLGSSRLVCGRVNADNAMGGRTGFRQFIYVDPVQRIASSEAEDYGIFTCCNHLLEHGKGGAKTTGDIAACDAVEPMPLIG